MSRYKLILYVKPHSTNCNMFVQRTAKHRVHSTFATILTQCENLCGHFRVLVLLWQSLNICANTKLNNVKWHRHECMAEGLLLLYTRGATRTTIHLLTQAKYSFAWIQLPRCKLLSTQKCHVHPNLEFPWLFPYQISLA